jgi:hypothetical protein
MWALRLLPLLLLGCVPSFEVAGCYGPGECPTQYTCIDRRCVPVDAGQPDAQAEPDLGVVEAQTLQPRGGAEAFGASIVPLGDLNGDGFADLAISAPKASSVDCPALCGRVYVYLGTPKGPALQAVIDGPPVLNGEFGFRVAPAGDLNGDGYADFAVSSHQPRVHVFHGGPDGLSSGRADRLAQTVLETQPGRTRYGLRMGAADLDGDGFDDLVVNGRLYERRQCGRTVDTSGVNGALWVYRGSARGIDAVPVQLDWPSTAESVCACGGYACGEAEEWAFGPEEPSGETPLIVAAPGAWTNRGEVVVLRLSRPGEVGERVQGVCNREMLGLGFPPFGGVVALGDARALAGVLALVQARPQCADGLARSQWLQFATAPGRLGAGTPLDLLPQMPEGARLLGGARVTQGPGGVFAGLLMRVDAPQPGYWFSAWQGAALQPAQQLAGSETSAGAAALWWPKADGRRWFLETHHPPNTPQLAQVVRWHALPDTR